MSEENLDSAQTGAPEMDQETYEMIQELFQLVRAGDAARLKGLFERGFDAPNIRDGKGNSLLMLASYNGQLETTRVLLEHGGDPQIANDMGQIPLAGAAFKGNTEMTRLLIEHGADVNARMADGKTPLMFAAMFDRLEIIDLLLAHGADVSLQTNEGLTARGLAQVMGAEAAGAKLEKLAEN
jgi:ankyrin repeat protein